MLKVNLKSFVFVISLLSVALFYSSCKSKKVAVQSKVETQEVVETKKPVETVKEEIKEVAQEEEKVQKSFDFKNIQFEFNSSVLKTSSYSTLETIAQLMKRAGSQRFLLNGHSSAEGTVERNLALSVDRANAVKSYLVNNGIASSRLMTKGFGETQPVANNSNENGRVLNRRVEILPEN